jgi:hypothetical protein
MSPPTGFASCWKQQPMMLEDAHGTFLAIPIDVVVSWQVKALQELFLLVTNHEQIFDDVLQSHFQKLPGAKKVAKREFAIEDSLNRKTFSRDCQWTSFCKAGLKIDMSMIFNDRNKTSMVCPKCDTISNEEKGIMVEW